MHVQKLTMQLVCIFPHLGFGQLIRTHEELHIFRTCSIVCTQKLSISVVDYLLFPYEMIQTSSAAIAFDRR